MFRLSAVIATLFALLASPGTVREVHQPSAVTLGSVIMMAAEDVIPTERLTVLLGHEDPTIRRAAARVAAISRSSLIRPAIEPAATRETDPAVRAELERAVQWLTKVAPIPDTPQLKGARLLPPWVAGGFSAAARAAGCSLSGRLRFGYAHVFYGPEGRARSIEVDTIELNKACASVLSALARLTAADPEDLSADGHQQWLVLPFSRRHFACTDDPQPPAVDSGEGVPLPRRTKDARPEYPTDMQRQQMRGVVLVEGVVSAGGCVVEAKVRSEPTGSAGIAALKAISAWEYEPMRLDGRPLAVRHWMSVLFGRD